MTNALERYKTAFDSQITKFNEVKSGLKFAEECAFAFQMVQSNQKLQECDENSFKNAILNVALTGISLNPVLQYAFLIPRAGKCVLDISFRGLLKIAYDGGALANMDAEVVRERDKFAVIRGTTTEIKHVPDYFERSGDRGEIIGVYSVATYPNGQKSICIMNRAEVEEIKAKSAAVKAGRDSIWKDWEGEMYKKTCIKRHYKILPKSEKLAQAVAVLNEHEGIDFEAEAEEIKEPQEVVVTEGDEPDKAEGQNPITQDYPFLTRMKGYKERLGAGRYYEEVGSICGVEHANEIINPADQRTIEDRLKDLISWDA